jgi:hypothetical protein
MPNNILIRRISNLTEARYYAAMQVDWISIELTSDPNSFGLWHNFRDWVSGVKLAAELNTDDESLIAKVIIDATPDGIVYPSPDIIHLTGGINLFVPSQKLLPTGNDILFDQIISADIYDSLNALSSNQVEHIYIESRWSTDSLRKILDGDYRGGISFLSEGETATGMKDFTMMDEMLEMIRG